ncbi:MAG: ABC transporter permease [Nitrososphaerota archaeon]|nr:ABC transporter permease [Nitrososphaerota archaeon]
MALASLGFRNSFRKPLRTFLSVAGIALCIVLMLTVVAVSDRYTTVVDQSYTVYKADLLVVSRGALLLGGLPLGAVVSQGVASQVAGVRGVESATPLLVVVDVKELVPSNITIGVPIQNFSMFAEATPLSLQGSYPSSADQVVVGNYLASTEGLRVGSTLENGGAALTVSGILVTSNVVLSNAVVMPLQTAQAELGYYDLVSAVLVDTQGNASQVASNIMASVPGVGAIPYGQSQAITAPLLSSVGTFDVAMGALAAALAVLFVTVIVSVNILEERDELSTMVAMGASTGSVLKVALAETSLVTLLGAALGVVASAGATAFVFERYAGVTVQFTPSGISALLPGWVTLLAVLGLLAVGMGVGLASAVGAVRRAG